GSTPSDLRDIRPNLDPAASSGTPSDARTDGDETGDASTAGGLPNSIPTGVSSSVTEALGFGFVTALVALTSVIVAVRIVRRRR
ncbi:MAG: hypothetical protein ACQETI_12965, partial [Halobacteriota archaeon]